MRAARTLHPIHSGRLGNLQRPFRGGCGLFPGPVKIMSGHGLTQRSGRLGNLGRNFLTLTRVRARTGVWGLCRNKVIPKAPSYVAAKVPPQSPQPPFFTGNHLVSFSNSRSIGLHSSSLFYLSILPNLPDEKKGHQPIGLKGCETTTSGERAMP